MISLKHRCTTCNDRFQDAPGVCPVCESNTWEAVVYDDAPAADVPLTYRHPSGAAFFAYEEAAVQGEAAPAWAASAIPALSAWKRREQLQARKVQAIAANKAYIDLPSRSNAQVAAQVLALTRQVNSLLRLELGQLDTVD